MFSWLLIVVTALFAWILWPFFGAILWAAVVAILFMPLQRRLEARLPGRGSLAALATLAVVILIVILPFAFLATALVKEAAGVYERMQSGEIDFGRYFRQVFDALPAWAAGLLERFGMGDVQTIQQRASESLVKGSRFLTGQALKLGQGTLDFVVSLFIMLYLLFFLLRDGDRLVRRMRMAVPLRQDQQAELLERFGVVTRATVKGNLIVAILQGALGGLAFWYLDIRAPLLWGVLMAVLSLLPAVGTALVWGPVAIYLLATGSVWQGVGLLAFGVLVIGLVDNVVCPMLVGKDTKLPDYLVLITTLGGLALFGVNGFIIGPVIAAMFVAAWDLFAESRREARGASAR